MMRYAVGLDEGRSHLRAVPAILMKPHNFWKVLVSMADVGRGGGD